MVSKRLPEIIGDYEKKLKELNVLIELSGLINSSIDIAEIRRRSIEAATRLVNAEAGSLLFVDNTTGDLFFDVAIGEKDEAVKDVHLKKGQGIAGWVAEHKRPVIVNDAKNDPRFFKETDEKSGFVTKNIACLPIKTKDKLIGVLEIINKKEALFNNKDLRLLTALANQVAIAIENARLYEELKETFRSTVHTLAETIEMRDTYTGGHTRRVVDYSLAVGEKMGLSSKDLVELELAAILHDIGKIGIRDDLLLKKDGLSHDDYKNIKKHVIYGADMLKHVKQLKDSIPGVKYHHENYDGSGYPEGLKGEDIPIIARIIAVTDAFDSMTTERPYRKKIDPEEAFVELKKNSGVQFDPKVVNTFISIYKKVGFRISSKN